VGEGDSGSFLKNGFLIRFFNLIPASAMVVAVLFSISS
jgi:hypothetical protein